MAKVNMIPASRYREFLQRVGQEIRERDSAIAYLAPKAEAYDLLKQVILPNRGGAMRASEDILRVIEDELAKTPSHVEPTEEDKS